MHDTGDQAAGERHDDEHPKLGHGLPADQQRRAEAARRVDRRAGDRNADQVDGDEGKAWEALSRIYPGRADGAWIAISTPYDSLSPQAADEALTAFAKSFAPHIDQAIDRAVGLAD